MTVQRDAYHIYRKLLAEKYQHQYQVFNLDSDIFNWLHIAIGNAKEFVNGTFHGLEDKHLLSYLDEFCDRFNPRFRQAEIFPWLLCAIANASSLPFAVLTA